MEYAVKAVNVSKAFGKKRVLDKVHMAVPEGKIYGLIGENGAGKTTLMRVICNMAGKTDGEILIFGNDDWKQNKGIIGCSIETPALYPAMTAEENLKAHGMLLPDFREEQIAEVLQTVGLQNTGKKKVKHFSLGMKQRLAFASALLGQPRLLVLDEPMNGLDPVAIKEMRETLQNINKKLGITILISSHLLDELVKVSDLYGIMKEGRLIREITAEEIERSGKRRIKIQVEASDEENAWRLAEERHYKIVKREKGCFYIEDQEEEDWKALIEAFMRSGIGILKIDRNTVLTEELFLSFIQGSEKDEGMY